MKADLVAARALRRTDRPKWRAGRREAGRRDVVEDLLNDADFWAEHKRLMLEVMEPKMRDIFDQGIAMAKTFNVPGYKPSNVRDFLDPLPGEIDDWAAHVFRNYVDDWWLQLEHTTREALRAALQRSALEGTGVQGVIRDIEPLFGRVRAERIGVTETTRLFGLGAQATYQATQMEGWEWQTVSDGRVCPICIGRAGKQYPITLNFAPAHVSCRCFPQPVLRLAAST